MCDHVCKHTLNSVSGLRLASINHTTQPNMNEFHRLGWYQVSSLVSKEVGWSTLSRWLTVVWPSDCCALGMPQVLDAYRGVEKLSTEKQKMHRLCVYT